MSKKTTEVLLRHWSSRTHPQECAYVPPVAERPGQWIVKRSDEWLWVAFGLLPHGTKLRRHYRMAQNFGGINVWRMFDKDPKGSIYWHSLLYYIRSKHRRIPSRSVLEGQGLVKRFVRYKLNLAENLANKVWRANTGLPNFHGEKIMFRTVCKLSRYEGTETCAAVLWLQLV